MLTPCTIWPGGKTAKGYGEMWDGTRVVYAHRVAYERTRGPIPPGLQIDHLCRNRGCVNPGHLEAVTPAENVRRGTRTKLNVQAVHEIRARLSGGARVVDLADEFGVSRETISHIKHQRIWVGV